VIQLANTPTNRSAPAPTGAPVLDLNPRTAMPGGPAAAAGPLGGWRAPRAAASSPVRHAALGAQPNALAVVTVPSWSGRGRSSVTGSAG